ncbi:MAG: Mur ligase family protein [Acidobacteriota bacterium]
MADLDHLDGRSLDVHFVAIGGTGMAPLACLLQELGHHVRGSDGPLYPPMSTLLEEAGIEPRVGFEPAHLEPAPDLVVIGNAVPRDNPQARATEERGLAFLSMPQAVSHFLLRDRRPLVVAGTHGKTTTTTMAAWVWERCGAAPGWLVGGRPLDLHSSFHLGSGERFVIEGDEYNAAYFDRGAKFLHYRPQALILTSAEYDHADLYPTPEDLLEAFRQLLRLPGSKGVVAVWGDDPALRALVDEALPADDPDRPRVVTYGLSEVCDVRPLEGVTQEEEGTRFSMAGEDGEPIEVRLSVPGLHNLWNALGVWAIAREDELPLSTVAAALETFRGAERRLQELGSAAGVIVVDDFAHHPTAVRASLAALRQRYPGRSVTALFEPRSLTAARRDFQQAYRSAFGGADRVFFAPIFHAQRLAQEERLDAAGLSLALREEGIEARACTDLDDVFRHALESARPGEVLVTMSSGAFGDLPRRLLAALEEREAEG